MPQATVTYYVTTSGENPVKKFIDSLSPKQQTKVLRIFQTVEVYGLIAILPHCKKLTGTPLWEIRILGKDNIRVIYLIPQKVQVLVLHGFIKKTQKTSKSELNTALSRFQEWKKTEKIDN